MAEEDRLNQLRQTCNGIRRVFYGRLQIISSLKAERETVVQEWQDITNQALNETELVRRRELRRLQSQLVSRRQQLEREIGHLRRRLEDVRNDFELNGCFDIGPPL